MSRSIRSCGEPAFPYDRWARAARSHHRVENRKRRLVGRLLAMRYQRSAQLIIIRFAGYRCDRAELPIHLAVGTSGEIESIGVRVSAAAQGYRPQPVNR